MEVLEVGLLADFQVVNFPGARKGNYSGSDIDKELGKGKPALAFTRGITLVVVITRTVPNNKLCLTPNGKR